MATGLTRKSTNVQIVIFLMLAAVGFSAERINEYCALNYEDIASQQYFVRGGTPAPAHTALRVSKQGKARSAIHIHPLEESIHMSHPYESIHIHPLEESTDFFV